MEVQAQKAYLKHTNSEFMRSQMLLFVMLIESNSKQSCPQRISRV